MPHSAETKATISKALEGNTNRALCVYVYDSNNVLIDSFPSHTAAGEFLGVHQSNVSRIINTGRRNRKGFLMSSTPLT
jgi:hypothetical protein